MKTVTVMKPKITLAMLMCGIVSAACVGAASAATPGDDTLSVIVKYDPQNVSTPEGAKALYRRLVRAAADVCPADSSSGRFCQSRGSSVPRAVGRPRGVQDQQSQPGRGLQHQQQAWLSVAAAGFPPEGSV